MMKFVRLFALLLALVPACVRAQVQEVYVKHSSGLILAYDASKERGVIVEAGNALARKLQLLPNSDGSVSVATTTDSGELRYLALSGNWNTTFQTDGTAAVAHYFVEATGTSNYVRLRCKSNNKYLGVDNTTDGSSVFSDKNGTAQLHFWYFADTPDAKPDPVVRQYLVNPADLRQPCEGWGVSLCWWANMCGKWDDAKIDQLVDWLVSPTGLNYNIFRYNIGGGDDPHNANCTPHHMGNGKGLRAEMEGFKDYSGDSYHWDRDAAQRKIMLKIKEKRPDAIFEAFSNSAPFYMTYSGCVAGAVKGGDDNLRPEFYKEFAHYLVDVCKHYKDEYGIEFVTLEPFNEPNTNYWSANGGQEGCHFSFSSQIAFLKVLAPILAESGLKTIIAASDETSVATSVSGFKEFQKAGVMDLVGQWNTHTYTATIPSRAQIGSLARSEGKRLWMSEVGSSGTGIAGNLSLMQRLMDDVRYIMPTVWIDWQYVEEKGDQWCTVRGSFSGQTFERVKSYYVHQHITRFIQAGYTFVSSLNASTLAAVSPGRDSLVLVAINTDGSESSHSARILFGTPDAGAITALVTTAEANLQPLGDVTLDEHGVLHYTLPSLSIATFIIPLTDLTPDDGQLRADVPYLIIPQYNTEVALATDDAGQLILASVPTSVPSADEAADGASVAERAIWTLKADGDQWQLRNNAGQAVSVGSSYALQTSEETASALSIQPVEDYFCRIMTNDTKAFDLKNEGYAVGTVVGQYAYGSSASAGQRHWHLLRLSDDFAAGGHTAVRDIADAAVSQSADLYDLSGRRVLTGLAASARMKSGNLGVSRGLYIRGGKKILVTGR
ncbi:MAG: hypothetical protein IJK15_06475 [Bacteroidaceae bacterium]|nr:hypothetical protein [Bacteroidaceae bacterium]